MVITRLNGGLGNQMFQYALGRNLSELLNVEFKIDISKIPLLERDNIKDINEVHFYYQLGFFNIVENLVSQDDIKRVNIKSKNVLRNSVEKIANLFKNETITYIDEKYFEFDPSVLELGDNIYLDGFWQSEKYFQNIEQLIREEFTLKQSAIGKNKKLQEQIYSTNSISILVRRGALVSDSKTNAIHGYCPTEYYEFCVREISEKIKDPVFFIFSDEPDWVEENLKLPYPVILVRHNGREDYHEDLRLMASCKHAITSNSTWGWWGAWLIENKDKIVYAPKNWFKSNKLNPKDLFPEGWILV